MTTTLDKLALEYTHYLTKPRNGFTTVFTVDACEVCGGEVAGPNAVGVSVRPFVLRGLGFEPRDVFPDEGGYSELHEAATCSACCYDPGARRTAVAP